AVFTGVGPFQHNDPRDRPPEAFAKTVTLQSGPGRPSHVLLPVVPPERLEPVGEKLVTTCTGAANLRSMVKPFRPYDLDQRLLLPPDLREWLPDDHLALFVSD